MTSFSHNNITVEYLQSLLNGSLSAREVLELIKHVHIFLLNEFNVEVIRLLLDIILYVKKDECFDAFIELYFDFKNSADFINIILQCKDVYFLRFLDI